MKFFNKVYYLYKAWIYLLFGLFIWADFELGNFFLENPNRDDVESITLQISTRLVVFSILIAATEGIENFVKFTKRRN